MAKSKHRSATPKAAPSDDAIAMLIADHKQVKELFKQFQRRKEQEEAEGDKASLVEQVCRALTLHTQLEEEIFYPAVREAIDDAELVDEALVEHAGAKELIAQLEGMKPDDDLYDAKVIVLSEQIAHHVEEEEGEMFPKARRAKLDSVALGKQMRARKAELLDMLGADADDEESAAVPPRRGSPVGNARREKAQRAKA